MGSVARDMARYLSSPGSSRIDGWLKFGQSVSHQIRTHVRHFDQIRSDRAMFLPALFTCSLSSTCSPRVHPLFFSLRVCHGFMFPPETCVHWPTELPPCVAATFHIQRQLVVARRGAAPTKRAQLPKVLWRELKRSESDQSGSPWHRGT